MLKIDTLANLLDADTYNSISTWPFEGDPEILDEALNKAILISKYPEEQMIWLVPFTEGGKTSWQTWTFAYWAPGEYRYPGFRHYMEGQVKED